MEDKRRFFFTGDPTNELGVSHCDGCRVRTFRSTLDSLSMGWRMDRVRCAEGSSRGEAQDDRFRLDSLPVSE